MLKDALAADRLITMAVLRPGWEADYEGRPPLYPCACLGQVVAYHPLPDGTYNLLLLGMRRVRLLDEQSPTRPYRVAQVELVEEHLPATAEVEVHWKRQMRSALFRVLPLLGQWNERDEQLEHLLETGLSLSALTDMLSYLLDLPIDEKHALLAEADVVCRARRVLGHLKRLDERIESQAVRPESVRCYHKQFHPN